MEIEVERALAVLFSTTSTTERAAADAWLREVQLSEQAWAVAAALVSDASKSVHVRQFGATMLCNKVRMLCSMLRDL